MFQNSNGLQERIAFENRGTTVYGGASQTTKALYQSGFLVASNKSALDNLYRKETLKAPRGSLNHQNDGAMMAGKVERNQNSSAESKSRKHDIIF